jgi:glycosyltransferase involved in cell wall biosynthesis
MPGTSSSRSPSHCVIIPSFNSGDLLEPTVRDVLAAWSPVYLVIDGSTDRSAAQAGAWARREPGLSVLEQKENRGKGAAVLAGLERAAGHGFSHAAVFDADGQHRAEDLPKFMAASDAHPEAMVLGSPIFGADAPGLRVYGRRAGNWCTHLETWWGGIGDSLFGLRVYPIRPALEVLRRIRGGRGFDFDTQLAVRLYWRGVPPLNIPTKVRYRHGPERVSHFRYLRDNLLLAKVHACLLGQSLAIAPRLWRYRGRPPLAWP